MGLIDCVFVEGKNKDDISMKDKLVKPKAGK